MKNTVIFFILAGLLSVSSCKEESQSDAFVLLTGPVWQSDSLLANGVDASGPGGILELFKGEAKFNTDGTGYFGTYEGTWRFASNETQIVIISPSLIIPLTTIIKELTSTSLKITTSYTNPATPNTPTNIRMTFIAK
jgi:hypothetical protein